ncbi:uncharacterized protein LOC113633901 [Tachysurus fulvidraco]|uniref:uncharacterized protein LOC113633901 n=1 Tax=Tachysurus fulvidraco TaxID=1234273 RepID=UPI001FEDFE34|nr:uncharacterized protein LOC113633901 [Tachysurus fulvidraco]
MIFFFVLIVVKNIAGAVDSRITPDKSIISSSEGSNITLTCTYDDSAYNLHWYRQKPQSEPEFLLQIHKSTDTRIKHELDPRLSTKLRKNEKKVDLEIFPAAVSDSALYYCAMVPTLTQNSNRLYKKSSLIFCFSAGGAHTLILGLPCLRLHNPTISWSELRITSWGSACATHTRDPVEPCQLNTTDTMLISSDIPGLPDEYLDLADAFSKVKATELPSHCACDCAMYLLPGVTPPRGRIFPPHRQSLRP